MTGALKLIDVSITKESELIGMKKSSEALLSFVINVVVVSVTAWVRRQIKGQSKTL